MIVIYEACFIVDGGTLARESEVLGAEKGVSLGV